MNTDPRDEGAPNSEELVSPESAPQADVSASDSTSTPEIAPEEIRADAAPLVEHAADETAPDPVADTTTEAAAESSPPAEPTETITSENSSADAESGPESESSAENEARGEGGFRVQIGSLGDSSAAADAKPIPSIAEPSPEVKAALEAAKRQFDESPREKFPPPNASKQLSPELEKEVEDALSGMSIEALLDDGAPTLGGEELEPETRVTGKVASVHREDVFIELGGNRQGAVPVRQFVEEPKPGDELELVVSRYNAEEGLYELTLPNAAVEVADWSELEDGVIVQAVVTGHNKGGLECQVNSIRAFMPVSQIALFRVEDLEEFVGQSFPVLVTEANPERKNLVVSRRAVLEREKAEAREKMIASLAIDQEYEGIVRSIQSFGAFVDLGGVDGLLHISKLSWERIDHPSQVLKEGQKVRVRIEKYDRDSGKIGLDYLDKTDNPWKKAAENYAISSTVSGTVSRLADFGAFVRLEPGVEGLIHISELAHQRVHRASDVVQEGQEVEVQVLSVDPVKQRIGLSLKALSARPTPVDSAKKEEEEMMAQIEASNKPVKKPQGPLKGGTGRSAGGDQFGLKW
ncbi:MAG: S1 RNA-binding domain-containing protein [Planctomycetales bacterium]|nr:S1 RNA-binding domain-containing protein [Planctomycetales bacterium]